MRSISTVAASTWPLKPLNSRKRLKYNVFNLNRIGNLFPIVLEKNYADGNILRDEDSGRSVAYQLRLFIPELLFSSLMGMSGIGKPRFQVLNFFPILSAVSLEH